jgi:hypothetical protein
VQLQSILATQDDEPSHLAARLSVEASKGEECRGALRVKATSSVPPRHWLLVDCTTGGIEANERTRRRIRHVQNAIGIRADSAWASKFARALAAATDCSHARPERIDGEQALGGEIEDVDSALSSDRDPVRIELREFKGTREFGHWFEAPRQDAIISAG